MTRPLGRTYQLVYIVDLVLVAVALHLAGAREVRTDAEEIFLLTFIAGVWLICATQLFSWFGLSLRDDVTERQNFAALVALCAAIGAATLIYIGGSLGEGPSYWNNFFSVGLATLSWLALWLLLETSCRASIAITEDRDLASGIRLSGFLIAIGLVLGRAVAGDWHSEAATVHDLWTDGWPAILICALAIPLELFLRPSRNRPFPGWLGSGVVPAVLYLGLAGAWVWHIGPWEGLP